MEFTHRALGNRSILADPRNKNMKNIINKAVKYREGFRPFAPAVLGEKAHEIFDIKKRKENRVYGESNNGQKQLEKIIPAVTHIDGTARVQTVFENYNPKFYKLIKGL